MSQHLLVWEYLTGGGLFETDLADADSLRREGAAMVGALTADLAAIEETTVHWLHDDRAASQQSTSLPCAVRPCRVGSRQELEQAFDRLVSECDGCFIIAPETDGILLRWTRRVVDRSARLLSAPAPLVAIASDKWQTHQVLRAAGVPVPNAMPADHPELASWAAEQMAGRAPSGRLVIKPRDGAGSHGVRGWDPRQALPGGPGELIEEFVEGTPAGVLALCRDGAVTVLPPTRQLIDPTSFAYQGGIAPLESPQLRRRAADVARRAVEALPVQDGFVGVDVVLGTAGDGSHDVVIEVNPRLTTSYVGLRAVLRGNLARGLLDPGAVEAWNGSAMDAPVRFSPSGQIAPLSGST